jgi:hypothetical protein
VPWIRTPVLQPTLILSQPVKNLNNGYKLLRKQGARNALFRLTLELYRYTFVAEGTITI